MKPGRLTLIFFWLLLWAPSILAQTKAIYRNYWDQVPLKGMGNTLNKKYIITTPGYMGPNALPVPDIKKGLVENEMYFRMGGEVHFGKGDHTENLQAKFYYPIVPGKIAMELYGVPYEYFTLNDEIKQFRRIQDSASTGHTWGDVYFGTVIQVIKDKHAWPDLALTLTCKTASGNNLILARFTDSPGYFFDMSMGKNIPVKGKQWLRLYGAAGFYVWQTNSDSHRQDDALMYGLGAQATFKYWQINNVWAGYNGYLHYRDKPMVYRFQLTRRQQRFQYYFEYQAGLHNFNYNSFKLGATYLISLNTPKAE
jgi:hypothetical protein